MRTRTGRKWIPTMIVLLSIFGWLAGCTLPGPPPPATPSPTVPVAAGSQIPLKVGVSTNMPPLIFKQGDQITGLEAELAKGLADYLGRPLQFVEVEWKDQIPYLLDRRTDIIMSGLSVTELRKVRIAFSDPYSRTGQMALIRRGDLQRFKMGYYSIVETPSIGAVENTTGALLVRERYEKAKKRFFKTSAEGIEALRNKTIDLMIHDAPVVLVLAAEHESELEPIYSLLTEEYLAWGLRREDGMLLKSVNAYINDMKRDGRLQTVVNRWMPLSGK
ncbi:MAG: transporter substrate-binding domain-containing protein [Desulfobacteraceae bacterium]|nr:transporter substrate-binding domain-containing protein [Desulfobacteraceae bacterium]MBC2749913.1 transporter substrate-binding domain-containing protein [Desulfobacteraceae bacterium]